MPNPTLEGIPTVTFSISNLLEARKDLIRKESNAYPGGCGEYYGDYKSKTRHQFHDEETQSFDAAGVYIYTSKM